VQEDKQSLTVMLKRIDFLGAALMMVTILALLLTVQLGVGKLAISDPILICLIIGTICSGTLFCLVETYWAKEPIFPLYLFTHRAILTSYSALAIQNALQLTVRMSRPFPYSWAIKYQESF
jgi:hypothetical protein